MINKKYILKKSICFHDELFITLPVSKHTVFKVACLLLFSCQIVSDFCTPVDCSLPGSSLHGIF